MIHGLCVDHRLLLGLDQVLAARGTWRRIYLDLPGMGASVAGPGIRSSDAVAAAVVDFVRENLGSRRFAVLGNSFGGMLARHLVAEFGDQVVGLGLLCPVAVAEKSPSEDGEILQSSGTLPEAVAMEMLDIDITPPPPGRSSASVNPYTSSVSAQVTSSGWSSTGSRVTG